MLDTNVVLDWMLFAEPAASRLADAIVAGRLRWVTTPWMRSEFLHVLGRGLAASRGADGKTMAAQWDRHGVMVDAPDRPGTGLPPLVCTDPDDQPFIDLALAVGANWLVSRDKALLRLRTRAAARGLRIVTPQGWHDQAAQ